MAGGFHLQVSEFVKLVIILLVARFLTELKTEDLEGRDMAKIAGLVLVPMAPGDETAGPGNGINLYVRS